MALRFTLLVGLGLLAQPWTLPRDTQVKDAGPRTYRFTVDYTTADARGHITQRQRLDGKYTRGLPSGDAAWQDVTLADAKGPTDALGAPQPRAFMQGFRYRNGSDLASVTQPDFFKGFPPEAVMERNLVWDTGMIELFGQRQFEHLRLNEPYHVLSNEDVKLQGVGTFHNRDVELIWVGRSLRNGRECAVVQYRAFLNPLAIDMPGVKLDGRSNYWGEIWVAVDTRQIEFATLQEEVVGELAVGGQAPQVIDVFRSGVLAPVQGQ